jgi:hypothetical protein
MPSKLSEATWLIRGGKTANYRHAPLSVRHQVTMFGSTRIAAGKTGHTGRLRRSTEEQHTKASRSSPTPGCGHRSLARTPVHDEKSRALGHSWCAPAALAPRGLIIPALLRPPTGPVTPARGASSLTTDPPPSVCACGALVRHGPGDPGGLCGLIASPSRSGAGDNWRTAWRRGRRRPRPGW